MRPRSNSPRPAPTRVTPGGTDVGTPFRYRFSTNEGIEIDVAESRANSLQVVYLDANDLPVAFDTVDHAVPTYDFPGEPTTFMLPDES